MKYIIFAIDTHVEEFLFIFEYAIGGNRIVLGELVKLNNLCYLKGFELDFFEIIEDPSTQLSKEGIYIYKYNNFTDLLQRLDIKLTPEEIQEFKVKNKIVFDTLTKKSNQEIMVIINNEDPELFRQIFEKTKKK
jgi:hypothetical protein